MLKCNPRRVRSLCTSAWAIKVSKMACCNSEYERADDLLRAAEVPNCYHVKKEGDHEPVARSRKAASTIKPAAQPFYFSTPSLTAPGRECEVGNVGSGA